MSPRTPVSLARTVIATDDDWRLRGSCRDDDPDAWFSDATAAYAAFVCLGCPVIAQCLEAALAFETGAPRWGVWGGKTAEQRRRIANNRRRGVQRRSEREAS